MAALPNLLTVAEFRQLPERGDVVYELQHGEVVTLTKPKALRYNLQIQLQELLLSKLSSFGKVVVEAPYRPLPEFEQRAADVAIISHSRWKAVDLSDNLHGAPSW